MPFTVVLDSLSFLEEVLPEVSALLGDETQESILYGAIRHGRHQILVTDRGGKASIKKEYETEATKRGAGPQLAQALLQLRDDGVVTDRNVPRRSIPNIPGYHRIFIEDAVAGSAAYFVTDHIPWLQLDKRRRIIGQLRIVNRSPFTRAARRSDR